MKRWTIGMITAILITLVFGQVSKANFKDCGIASIINDESIYELNAGMDYIFGNTQENEEFIYNSLTEYEDDYVNDQDEASIIVIGTATGNYSQSAFSFGQEIKVKRVIIGTDVMTNDIIYVYNTDGFKADDSGRPVYTNIQNIMFENSEYLIFLDPLELNEYTEEHVYSLVGSYFSYISLSKRNTCPIKLPLETLQFNELKDFEYFASSERILEQIVIVKQKIIDKYIN